MGIEKHLIAGRHPRPTPPPTINFSGVWTNRLGSEMELTVEDGRITGWYRTAVGDPSPTEEFPLCGFVSGDLIAFTVNFGKYDSLTAWTGQHTVEDRVETIHTLWHLAKNIPDEDEPKLLWAGILTGANIFSRR
jgi:avidin family protein